jgi:hypothetical protein
MAKDLFHQSVKTALTKDGWIITSDPLTIRIGRVKLEIDLAAERIFAAQKDGQKIAVEVKSFINPSNINDFHVDARTVFKLSSRSSINRTITGHLFSRTYRYFPRFLSRIFYPSSC